MRIAPSLLLAVVAISSGADAKLFGKDKRECLLRSGVF